MSSDSILRRITLFPRNGKPFDEEGLMAYIVPMGELKLLPSVQRGVAFKITDKGMVGEDSWTVDFSDKEAKIKVSVTIDRVDILSTAYPSWEEFMKLADSVVDIVVRNSKDGFSRLAVGYTLNKNIDEEELRRVLHIGDDEAVPAALKEKTEKTVMVEELESDAIFAELKYNNVHTITYTHEEDGWHCANDYDVNTVVGSDSAVVTGSVKQFIETAAGKLKSVN